MAIGNMELGFPLLLTASGQVAGGTAMARGFQGGPNDAGNTAESTALQGAMLGFFVASTNAGTLVLSAGTTSGGAALTGTITPAAGAWYYLPIISPTGIYATIGGSALSVTFVVVE
jgi:hypothetical protein